MWNTQFYHTHDFQRALELLLGMTKDGYRIAVSTNVPDMAIFIYNLITKSGLLIPPRVFMVHGGTHSTIVRDICKDCNAFMFTHDIQVIIYSPTLATGLSFDNVIDVMFGFYKRFPCIAHTNYQGLCRGRLVNSRVGIIWTEEIKQNDRRNVHSFGYNEWYVSKVIESMQLKNMTLYNILGMDGCSMIDDNAWQSYIAIKDSQSELEVLLGKGVLLSLIKKGSGLDIQPIENLLKVGDYRLLWNDKFDQYVKDFQNKKLTKQLKREYLSAYDQHVKAALDRRIIQGDSLNPLEYKTMELFKDIEFVPGILDEFELMPLYQRRLRNLTRVLDIMIFGISPLKKDQWLLNKQSRGLDEKGEFLTLWSTANHYSRHCQPSERSLHVSGEYALINLIYGLIINPDVYTHDMYLDLLPGIFHGIKSSIDGKMNWIIKKYPFIKYYHEFLSATKAKVKLMKYRSFLLNLVLQFGMKIDVDYPENYAFRNDLDESTGGIVLYFQKESLKDFERMMQLALATLCIRREYGKVFTGIENRPKLHCLNQFLVTSYSLDQMRGSKSIENLLFAQSQIQTITPPNTP